MSKKIVHYYHASPRTIGKRAAVYPVDHPDTENVSNEQLAWTSSVVADNPETGVFETLNTIYKPQEMQLDTENVVFYREIEGEIKVGEGVWYTNADGYTALTSEVVTYDEVLEVFTTTDGGIYAPA